MKSKRPRIKVRSDVDKRLNEMYKNFTRHEVKAIRIGLDMRKLSQA